MLDSQCRIDSCKARVERLSPSGSHAGGWRSFITKLLRFGAACAWFYCGLYGLAQPTAADRCNAITHLAIPDSRIVTVEFITGGEFKPPQGNNLLALPDFCRVTVVSQPAPDSNIRIEVWLPEGSWNGRLLGTGNGGGGGAIPYDSLAGGIRRGFATVTTDLGTSPNAKAVTEFPDRWADFGYRATHEMTVVAKQVLAQYYGKPAARAYFTGCSTGGQQAMSEAERYGEDYDGILAGAPANDRTHLHSEFLWNYRAAHETSDSIVPPERVALVTRSIVAACAGKDGGAPGDAFLTDPRSCKFNLDSLPLCSNDRATDCLRSAQLQTLKKVYAGPTNPRSGERIYAPLPFGAESSGLGLAYQESDHLPGEQFYPFYWAFGTRWDPMSFNFGSDEDRLDEKLAPLLNANNADLSAFRIHGGKLIMFTGTADPIVPFPDAIQYYERVVSLAQKQKSAAGSAEALAATQQFFRYYLVPGMAHCGNGPGLNNFGQWISLKDDDVLFRLEQWVENGIVPDQILAKGPAPSGGVSERYLCSYPELPDYIGGNPKSAASFRCTAHPRGNVPETSDRYQH
jgi:feruloyl esterase